MVLGPILRNNARSSVRGCRDLKSGFMDFWPDFRDFRSDSRGLFKAMSLGFHVEFQEFQGFHVGFQGYQAGFQRFLVRFHGF